MSELKTALKQQLIEALNLEHIKVEDIKDDAPLFGSEGLELDSIDALEIIVLLEKHYGIVLSNPEEGREVFFSIDSLSNYISKNKGQ